jgi:hypothetical protein
LSREGNKLESYGFNVRRTAIVVVLLFERRKEPVPFSPGVNPPAQPKKRIIY